MTILTVPVLLLMSDDPVWPGRLKVMISARVPGAKTTVTTQIFVADPSGEVTTYVTGEEKSWGDRPLTCKIPPTRAFAFGVRVNAATSEFTGVPAGTVT